MGEVIIHHKSVGILQHEVPSTWGCGKSHDVLYILFNGQNDEK